MNASAGCAVQQCATRSRFANNPGAPAGAGMCLLPFSSRTWTTRTGRIVGGETGNHPGIARRLSWTRKRDGPPGRGCSESRCATRLRDIPIVQPSSRLFSQVQDRDRRCIARLHLQFLSFRSHIGGIQGFCLTNQPATKDAAGGGRAAGLPISAGYRERSSRFGQRKKVRKNTKNH